MDVWTRGAFIVLALYVAAVIVTMLLGRRSPPVDGCAGVVVVGPGPVVEPPLLNAQLAGLRGSIVVIDVGDEVAAKLISRGLERNRRAVTVVRANESDINGIKFLCSLMDERSCLTVLYSAAGEVSRSNR